MARRHETTTGAAAEPRRTRLGRQRQVVTVLSRHGFGLLVTRSPLPLPAFSRSRLRGRPELLRAALEELGTTFIKLGQILSTRSDILPEDFIAALSTLQDRLPPVGVEAVRGVIQSELGAPPETLFAAFDPVPLATASIGQVHAVTLHSGERAVIKVQKPGIAREVELDLLILRDLSKLAVDRLDSPVLRSLEEAVEQFSDSLREELDYVHEGRNADHFRELLGADSSIRAPRIHWDLSSHRVLTMERIDGVKVNDIAALRAQEVDRASLARDLAGSVLQQIFEFGFFHADPHPGNYLVTPEGHLAVVDFGMIGTLDEATRRELLLLLAAWVKGDAEGMAEGLIGLGVARGGAESASLRTDMRRVVARYHDARLQELHLGRIVGEIFHLARRHHLILRGDLALMAKTVVMQEGMGLALDPQFHLVEAARPYVLGALRRLYLPKPDAQDAALGLLGLLDFASNFPQRAQRLLSRMERGDLGIAVRPEGIEGVLRDLNRMVNRLSVSILAAAFIVGLALLLQVVENSHGSLLLLALFAGALLASAVLGLWLLLSMYRAGRTR